MSHKTTYTCQVKDIELLHDTLDELQAEGKIEYEWLGNGQFRLYNGTVDGTGFKFSDWNYPCCIDEEGSISFDNYNGRWGKPERLDMTIQRYNQKSITRAARKQGFSTRVKEQKDGSIQVICYK